MAIEYEVTPNIISTLDVDGLTIPFNTGNIFEESQNDYRLKSISSDDYLNFGFGINVSDILSELYMDVKNYFYDTVDQTSPSLTVNEEDKAFTRWENVDVTSLVSKHKDINYTPYKGITIANKKSLPSILTFTLHSRMYKKDVSWLEIVFNEELKITLNNVPIYKYGSIVYTSDGIIEINHGNFFGELDTNGYSPIYLLMGGFYQSAGYCFGYVKDLKVTSLGVIKDGSDATLEYDLFPGSPVSQYLNYDDVKNNTRMKNPLISVKPYGMSAPVAFYTTKLSIENVMTANKRFFNIKAPTSGYVKDPNKLDYKNQGAFLYREVSGLKSFFNTENNPENDKTPFKPSGGGGDPYEKDPDSQGNNDPGGHKGGDGKYRDTDEDVPIPGLPQISATDTGLCTLYNPSNTELKELSDYLWSDVFSVESFKKLFADPMDIILGMSIVPLKVSDGARAEIKVGGLSTGVSMNKCKTQYIEVDCGSLDISNYWDNFMDYDPYTKYTLYLPYVGYKVLHADELVDKTITVKYHCDILSGACMAYVQCGKKVLYCFEGNISIQIPVTSASYDNMIHGMLQVASGVGQIIAGGASMAAGGAGAGLMVSGAVGTATGATSAIKPTIGRSGNAESSTGLMGIQKPYLIISRPRAVVPSGLNKYSGYPAYKGGKLGDFNNFTVVQDIRIKNLNGATMEEMNEAERLCKEGVIV